MKWPSELWVFWLLSCYWTLFFTQPSHLFTGCFQVYSEGFILHRLIKSYPFCEYGQSSHWSIASKMKLKMCINSTENCSFICEKAVELGLRSQFYFKPGGILHLQPLMCPCPDHNILVSWALSSGTLALTL